MKIELDKYSNYKVVFMKIAKDYIDEPSNKKSLALKKIVVDTLSKDPELLVWFNTMFVWTNTDNGGIDLNYKINPTMPF